jgi:hypothetical protein
MSVNMRDLQPSSVNIYDCARWFPTQRERVAPAPFGEPSWV